MRPILIIAFLAAFFGLVSSLAIPASQDLVSRARTHQIVVVDAVNPPVLALIAHPALIADAQNLLHQDPVMSTTILLHQALVMDPTILLHQALVMNPTVLQLRVPRFPSTSGVAPKYPSRNIRFLKIQQNRRPSETGI
ncbi:hypothetical protein GALMADRAFT_1040651 [Galerina marginata CBS 339.88]|uniref:Uncharacterized protein n=1 Tax=Galerina marginata (strain CBS 339.88) TaxID=685588 RepID=A0A067SED8_GALM3|nr:hypothetical protein GALMADRAFT_1040651 [Galerina marginata CBS 339.88]